MMEYLLTTIVAALSLQDKVLRIRRNELSVINLTPKELVEFITYTDSQGLAGTINMGNMAP